MVHNEACTRSSAVAERARDASYLSVLVSFNSTIPRAQSFIISYFAAAQCYNLTPPSKCRRHSTVQQSSMPKQDTGRKSRFLAQLGGYSSEYCQNILYGETRMVDLPGGEKSVRICLLVSTEYTNVHDGHPDRQTDGRTPHNGMCRAHPFHSIALQKCYWAYHISSRAPLVALNGTMHCQTYWPSTLKDLWRQLSPFARNTHTHKQLYSPIFFSYACHLP